MEKISKISEILEGNARLAGLGARSKHRLRVLDEVRAALPERLAQAVVSAGVEDTRLTIGVVGSVWASRIRYTADATRTILSEKLGVQLLTVRIRVVPQRGL